MGVQILIHLNNCIYFPVLKLEKTSLFTSDFGAFLVLSKIFNAFLKALKILRKKITQGEEVSFLEHN